MGCSYPYRHGVRISRRVPAHAYSNARAGTNLNILVRERVVKEAIRKGCVCRNQIATNNCVELLPYCIFRLGRTKPAAMPSSTFMPSEPPFIWLQSSAGVKYGKLRPYHIVVILLLLPNLFSTLPVDNDRTEASESRLNVAYIRLSLRNSALGSVLRACTSLALHICCIN